MLNLYHTPFTPQSCPSFGEVRLILAEAVLEMDCLIPPLLNQDLPTLRLNPNLLTSGRTQLWQSA